MAWTRWEIAFVLLTGLGNYVLAGWLGRRLAFVVGASLFWAGFVVVRAAANPAVLGEWGFRSRHLGRGITLLLPAAALVTSVFAAYGVLTGNVTMNWHFVLICLIYPIWGLVQQFLVVALLAGSLRRHSRIPEGGVVLVAALVFAVAHLPSLVLAAAAFVLALITTKVYFRTRNLWPLGLFHGWYATCLYFLALGQDPWTAVVATRLWR